MKLERIIKQIQEAGSAGVKESDILDDFETANNARVIKHRIKKKLGRNAIVIKSGVWYLSESYWNMTKLEFSELLNRSMVLEMQSKNNIVILSIVFIMCIGLIGTAVLFYELGHPRTSVECLAFFETQQNTMFVTER